MVDEKKDSALFKRLWENFTNKLKEIGGESNAELIKDRMGQSASMLRALTDGDGIVSENQLAKQRKALSDVTIKNRLDTNGDGYVSNIELATARDLTRLMPGKSVEDGIQTIRDKLERAGIDLGKEGGKEKPEFERFTNISKNPNPSSGISNTLASPNTRINFRPLLTTSLLQALDTGSMELDKSDGSKIVHQEGKPDKEVDSDELSRIPKHHMRGILDANIDGKLDAKESELYNFSSFRHIDKPVSLNGATIAADLGLGPVDQPNKSLPNNAPKGPVGRSK